MNRLYLIYSHEHDVVACDYALEQALYNMPAHTLTTIAAHSVNDLDDVYLWLYDNSLFNVTANRALKLTMCCALNKDSKAKLTQMIDSLYQQDEVTLIILFFQQLHKKDWRFIEQWFESIVATEKQLIKIDDRYIKQIAKQRLAGIQCTDDAWRMLQELHHDNGNQLLKSLEALILACNNNIIDEQLVQSYITEHGKYSVYDLSYAYLSGNQRQTMYIFAALPSQQWLLLHWLICEDVKKLLQLKSAIKNQAATITAALRQMGVWGKTAELLPRANQRLKYTQLIAVYNSLAQIDLAIKGVIAPVDTQLLLQQVLLLLSGG
jgi:DNA polymerase III delta subunit